MTRFLFAIFVIVAVPVAADANRVEFVAQYHGERVAGAEICFFRGAISDNPILTFAGGDEVRCLPADAVIDVPPGTRNFFARKGTTLVSSYLDLIEREGRISLFREVTMDLRDAVVVDVREAFAAIGPGERLALYIANVGLPDSPAVIRPVPAGASDVLVPANESVLPLVLRGADVIRIGNVFQTKGSYQLPPISLPSEGRADILAWARMDWGLIAKLESPLTGSFLSDVTVELRTAAGERFLPTIAPRKSAMHEFELFVFKNVPAGAGTLRWEGATWETRELGIRDLRQRTVWVAEEPLLASPASAVEVSWDTGRGLPAAKCAATIRDQPVTLLELRTCTEAACRTLQERTLTEPSGTVVFPGVSIGTYELRLTAKPLKPVTAQVAATPGRATTSIKAGTGVISGTISQGGNQLPAVVIFQGALAFTDDNGSFVATLDDLPDGLIAVRPCDQEDTYIYYPEVPFSFGSHLDIRLPNPLLSVKIRDGQKPVSGAMVRYKVLGKKPNSVLYPSHELLSNDDGIVLFGAVRTGSRIRVCAERHGYRARCADPVTFESDDEQKNVTLTLDPVEERAGKIRLPAQVLSGWMWWIGPDGEPTEMVPVQPEGDFTYQREHGPTEYCVFTSRNLPLFLFPNPSGMSPLEITYPPVRSRTFRVVAGPGDNLLHAVGLWVGNLRVPAHSFTWHQSSRGSAVMVSATQDLVIRDILETQQIAVTYGPSLPVLFQRPAEPDWFFDDAFMQAFPRKPIAADDTVAFP